MYKALPTLSPTAAKNFTKCPLAFRLQKIDKILFPPSPEALKGILTHKVLEKVFQLEPNKRHLDRALSIVETTWQEIVKHDISKGRKQDLENIVLPDNFYNDVKKFINNYFTMENPEKVLAEKQELWVSFNSQDVRFLGQIDRIDKSPDGKIRIVDYKTGNSPNPQFLDEVIFQLHFYSFLWQKNYHNLPDNLTLYYLKDGKAVQTQPSNNDINQLVKQINTIWQNIKLTAETNRWLPKKNKLCNWCEYQKDYCPLFGGTEPTLDPEAVKLAIGVKPNV
ncbi:MAG: PD-(D/E)XK nuclease family protein [Bifidobacteriaceae bacterium]|jgi:putative RecB family exonuclease|nr:PD-(D/E)XK nuclease family protein [Bifidobacteriaceae bacterium]